MLKFIARQTTPPRLRLVPIGSRLHINIAYPLITKKLHICISGPCTSLSNSFSNQWNPYIYQRYLTACTIILFFQMCYFRVIIFIDITKKCSKTNIISAKFRRKTITILGNLIKINNNTAYLYRTMRWGKLLGRRHGYRNATITTTTRMRRITIISAQTRSKSYMSLS